MGLFTNLVSSGYVSLNPKSLLLIMWYKNSWMICISYLLWMLRMAVTVTDKKWVVTRLMLVYSNGKSNSHRNSCSVTLFLWELDLPLLYTRNVKRETTHFLSVTVLEIIECLSIITLNIKFTFVMYEHTAEIGKMNQICDGLGYCLDWTDEPLL